MKVGIIGLPQTGKKTLFQALTSSELREQAGTPKPIPGTAEIVDLRFEHLVKMYQPAKEARARLELTLLPRLEQENIAKGEIFGDIASVDAICHVIRAFEDDSIYHAEGSVDAVRDMEMVNAELVMHDQIFVEKRIERLNLALRKIKDSTQEKELDLMQRMLEHLEAEQPLRLFAITSDEEELIRSYPFITRKEMILAFNVAEDQLDNNDILQKVTDLCNQWQMKAMTVCAQVESEIALLESVEERNEFLSDLGIDKPALAILTQLCLEALGLVSFFTVGKDEVRQWLVRRESPAPVAAGVIHSDLQRGFIRAEVMKYAELIEHGSEGDLKKAGKMYLQGKDYIVMDGDILNIRFKV